MYEENEPRHSAEEIDKQLREFDLEIRKKNHPFLNWLVEEYKIQTSRLELILIALTFSAFLFMVFHLLLT